MNAKKVLSDTNINKTSKGHLLEAKRALIRIQLSLNKNRSGEKYLQRGR